MIDIEERFTVEAPAATVFQVLSDPAAVVECVPGAELGDRDDDGTFAASLALRFSALRVVFTARVALETDERAMTGTVRATGRDGQGGTRFAADARFEVEPLDGDTRCAVIACGRVTLSGRMASVIEGAAAAIVRRMTADFVEVLARRCAGEGSRLGPQPRGAEPSGPQPHHTQPGGAGPRAAEPSGPEPRAAEPAGAGPAVLLLHNLGGSPAVVRPWGEALSRAGIAVEMPRLAGHATRWRDLRAVRWRDWYDAAERALRTLSASHPVVYVMGVCVGASIALCLADQHAGEVAGVVAVNPVAGRLLATPGPLALGAWLRGSVAFPAGDVHDGAGASGGYRRLPRRTVLDVNGLARQVQAAAELITVPVLLVTGRDDRVVDPGTQDRLWRALPTASRARRVTLEHSGHLVSAPDSATLHEQGLAFVQSTVEARLTRSDG